jgi:hypothetical protein
MALSGANNQNACFNWFQPEDAARDRGEALSSRQMIDAMITRQSVDAAITTANNYVFAVRKENAEAAERRLSRAVELKTAARLVGNEFLGRPGGCEDARSLGLVVSWDIWTDWALCTPVGLIGLESIGAPRQSDV